MLASKLHVPAISSGKKYRNINSAQPMSQCSCTQKAQGFLFPFFFGGFGGGGWGEVCLRIVLFPMCSHQVFNKFSMFTMCFPKIFLITPRFYPTYFVQSYSLLYRWAKGVWCSSSKISANQIDLFWGKKKPELRRYPHLIDTYFKKYPR